ncbi:MAG: CheB methylesterase, partial [Acidimicrobiales bacterium]|nr:CheB methylesterase [Acidimicrobiales bacterium]
MAYSVVAVGASWCGIHALGVLLEDLPSYFGPAVVVAQHRGTDGPAHLAEALAKRAVLPVTEASDKDALEPGHVYIAPAGYHLLVERGSLALSTDEPERFSRPSIDVLFESVADSYRDEAVGIVLTGTSEDGAAGLGRIRRRGGVTIAQDPTTAARRRMPDAAIAAGGVQRVLRLEEIAKFLVDVCGAAA